MTLYDELAATADARASEPAVVTATESVSYAELFERADRLGWHLERAHAGPGRAVVARLGDTPTFLVALLACARAGAVFTPLDQAATASEIEQTLAGFRGNYHFLTEADRALAAPRDARSVLLFEGGVPADDRLSPSVEPEEELARASMIQFTSGSTGEPKGILVSDDAMLARVRHLSAALELGPDDRTLCTLPLSHSHGVDCLALPSLLTGGTLFLHPPAAAAPNTVLSLLERHRISFFSSVPSLYGLAVKLLARREYDLSRLRLAFCGSVALTEEVARGFLDAFGVAILQGYGLAEVGPVTLNLDAVRTGRFDSIGRPMPGVDCRVTDQGELVVSSASLAHGYFRKPAAWREQVVGPELFTRDLVEVDESGLYHLVGRMSRLINVDGWKVNPREVEATLLEVDGVREAFVNGEGDALTGQRVVAHLAADLERFDSEDRLRELLRAHLRARLSAPKCPTRYVFHDELPKSALGKVQVERLKPSR